jgi:hypothetical protein
MLFGFDLIFGTYFEGEGDTYLEVSTVNKHKCWVDIIIIFLTMFSFIQPDDSGSGNSVLKKTTMELPNYSSYTQENKLPLKTTFITWKDLNPDYGSGGIQEHSPNPPILKPSSSEVKCANINSGKIHWSRELWEQHEWGCEDCSFEKKKCFCLSEENISKYTLTKPESGSDSESDSGSSSDSGSDSEPETIKYLAKTSSSDVQSRIPFLRVFQLLYRISAKQIRYTGFLNWFHPWIVNRQHFFYHDPLSSSVTASGDGDGDEVINESLEII